jgi:predicted phage replisome organizer
MADKIPEEVKWIKISTGLFEDEAIRIILDMPDGAVMLEIWLRLLIMAGKINDRGLIYLKKNENMIIPFTSDFFATIFNKKNKQIEFSLKTFEKFGMIKILNSNQILISNWEKYQNYDQMDKIRIQNNERQKRFREKQKAILGESNIPQIEQKSNVTCNVTDNVTVTACNGAEIELEIDTCNSSSCTCTTTDNSENCNVTNPLNNDQKLYGEFGNVCLSNSNYQKLLGITLSEKLLNQLIEDFSCAIAEGKEEDYRADKPDAHFVRLRKYYDWRKTHPRNDSSTTQGKIDNWFNS